MLNAFDNTLFVLLGLSILLFLYVFVNVYKHYKTLMSVDESEDVSIDTKYNSIKLVMNTYESLLKYTLRRFVKNYLFVLHYIHLFSIKFLAKIQLAFALMYSLLRDSFVKKSVQNKAYVKHFWGNLKEFKKEMDDVDDGSK